MLASQRSSPLPLGAAGAGRAECFKSTKAQVSVGGREGKVCDEAEVPGGSLVRTAILAGQKVEEKGQSPGVSPDFRSFLSDQRPAMFKIICLLWQIWPASFHMDTEKITFLANFCSIQAEEHSQHICLHGNFAIHALFTVVFSAEVMNCKCYFDY